MRKAGGLRSASQPAKRQDIEIQLKNSHEDIRENHDRLLLPDQDVLNALFGQQVLKLDTFVYNYDARKYIAYRLRYDAGLTVDDLYGDFVDGMNFTPSTPAFEDMRDGMLQSAAGTGRESLIWRGFAASGIGVGADGRVAPNGSVTIVQSFTVPPGC